MRRPILSGLLLLVTLATTFPAPAQEWRTHTVRKGENLTVIARRYDVTVSELREWNSLRSDKLLVGQVLRIPSRDEEWYVVRRGDTLAAIARRHDVTLSLLRELNELTSDRIYPGQRLQLLPSPDDEGIHVVRRGEALSVIAQRRGVSVATLKRLNGLTSDRIYPGQKLRLKDVDTSVHVVERGDALWEIAEAYGMSLSRLKELNGLFGDVIHPGQELRVSGAPAAPPRLAEYVVRRGDNLSEIAQLHQMSLGELRRLNEIKGSVIHPGQTLRVRPMLGGAEPERGGEEDWASLLAGPSGVRRFEAANGPYFHAGPRAASQRSRNYAEDSRLKPATAYKRARKLWETYLAAVDRLPRRSGRLEGWHFVLDPGHGGIDPGAIVPGHDQDGTEFLVVEDEYVYDLALRVAALLRLHGADVTPTLLSANHTLRGNSPPNVTFVHDRNEVYNDHAWNQRGRRSWPRGGQSYLDARVDIAERAVRGIPRNRQIFLSFHADNDPLAGDAVTLFYYQDRRRTDKASREFARALLPALGAGARMKGRSLGVLRRNPIARKLLIETRNLAYEEHVWSIRYEALRQRDAEKVVKALLDGLAPGGGGRVAAAGP